MGNLFNKIRNMFCDTYLIKLTAKDGSRTESYIWITGLREDVLYKSLLKEKEKMEKEAGKKLSVVEIKLLK